MDNEPRLFFLSWYSIYQMKKNLPKYRDNWQQMGKDKSDFSLEDVDEVKGKIRAFYGDDDGRKLLFVHKPFLDLTCQHGFVLIKDPDILEQMKEYSFLEKIAYRLEIWENCFIEVEEEKLAPNDLTDKHIYFYNGLPDVLTLVMRYRDQIQDGTSEQEKVAQLFAIFYSNSQDVSVSPIPKLNSEKGRRRLNPREFSHLFSRRGPNGSPTLEWVKFKAPIISDMRIRNLVLEVKNGSPVTLERRVDLQFFEQFRPTASSSDSNLENPQNFLSRSTIQIDCVPSTSKQMIIEKNRAEEIEEGERVKSLDQFNNGLNELNPNLREETLEKEPENVQEFRSTTDYQQTNPEMLEKEAELVAVSHAPISQVSFDNVELHDKTVELGSITLKLRPRTRKVSPSPTNEPKITSKTKQQTKKYKKRIESAQKDRVHGEPHSCSTTIFAAQRSQDRPAKTHATTIISKILQSSRRPETQEEKAPEVLSRINDCFLLIKQEKRIEEEEEDEQEKSIHVKNEVDLDSSAD